MVDFLGDFGASLARLAILAGWFFGSAWIGTRFMKDRENEFVRQPWYHNWLAWLMGILAAIILGLMAFPTINVLENYLCRNADDIADCIDSLGESE